MRLRFWLLALALPWVAAPAATQDLPDLDSTSRLAAQAMSLIVDDKIPEAFGVLRPHWPLPGPEIDTMAFRLSGERARVVRRLGESISFERVGVQALGDSFVQYIYLEKHERDATVWVLRFYKPRESWIVNSLLPLPSFDGLFQWLSPPLPPNPASPAPPAPEGAS